MIRSIETGLPSERSEEGILQRLIKKLEDEYVHYQNAALGWSAPSVIARGNYAHDLLRWLKEQMSDIKEVNGGEDNATE